MVEKKLENPLEISESVSDLGEKYVSLKEKLDASWLEWEDLFSD